MNKAQPNRSHRSILLSWTLRWLWILLAAFSLAWLGQSPQTGLWLAVVYGLAQIGLTLLLISDTRGSGFHWAGLALDLVLPAAIVAVSMGKPVALWFLLLAPVITVGLHYGSFVGFGAGLSSDVVVAVIWLAGLFDLRQPLAALPGWGLAALFAGQGLASLMVNRLKAIRLSGLPFSGPPRTDLPSVAQELVDQLPPDELPMDGKQLLRTTLELGLEVLTSTGLRPIDLSGLALVSDQSGLLEVGRSGLIDGEPFQFESSQGALASARKHGSIENVPNLKRDPELALLAERLAWRSAACLPIEDGKRCLGVLIFGHPKRNAFDSEKLEGLHALAQQAKLALRFAELYQEQLQESIRLGEIQEEARKKLARDLHDGPTQVIAAIAMRTNFARRQMTRDPETAEQELAKVEDMARLTTKEIRHMLFTLRPLILESQGLNAGLRQLAEKVRETHHQKVLVETEPNVEKSLPQASQVALFYIVEEAVTNAYKHAAAEHIWITLGLNKGGVVAEIKDDGVGFNVGEVDTHYEQRGSLGMVTMRERVGLLEGNFEIESEVGQGTIIRVRIPVNQAVASR